MLEPSYILMKSELEGGVECARQIFSVLLVNYVVDCWYTLGNIVSLGVRYDLRSVCRKS
jgi:hypothetical protein